MSRLPLTALLLLCSAADLRAGPGIAGEVTGPGGLLVPGAKVVLTLADGSVLETTSDAAGAFRFAEPPEGVHQLTVLGRGFADRTVEIAVGSAGEVRIHIPLELAFAERITVTGQQQERSLDDEPASVAVVSGDELDARVHRDLYELTAATPNVGGSSEVRGFSIRGVDQRGFGPEGGLLLNVSVDGATVQGYQGAFFGPYSTWDLDQVEVFRGPQSTQQGRNALAGAIVMRSRDPHYGTEVRARARAANGGAVETSAAVNVPLAPGKAALRVSVDRRVSDGFVENPTRGEDAYDFREALTMRAKLRFDPTTRFSGLLTLLAVDNRGGDGIIGADIFPGERTSLADHPAEDGSEHRAATLELGLALTDSLALESVSNLYLHDYHREEDLDRTPAPSGVLDYTTDDRWATSELRLRYAGPGRTRGVVGAYLADLEGSLRADAAGPGELAGLPPGFVLTSVFETDETTRNAALFGEFDLGLGRAWTLTLGARYDSETRETVNTQGVVSDPPLPSFPEATPGQPLEAEYRAFLPKAVLTRDWSETVSTSVGWQRGYRAGGRSVAPLSRQVSDFDPEFTGNWEFALRAAPPDRRWFLNANAFFADWTDQQVRVLTDLGLPVDTLTVNAGESRVRGAEIEAGVVPDRRLDLYGSLGLLDTRFDTFEDEGRDFGGNEFPHAPAWSALAGASLTLAEFWSVNTQIAAEPDSFSDPGNDPRFRVGARTLVNARLGYRRGAIGVFAFGQNLLDEPYLLEAWVATPPLPGSLGRAGAPRTIGIEIDLRY